MMVTASHRYPGFTKFNAGAMMLDYVGVDVQAFPSVRIKEIMDVARYKWILSEETPAVNANRGVGN